VIQPTECFSEGWQAVKPQYWLLVGITLVAILVGSAAPMGILMGPMMGGLHLCVLARLRGEQIGFERLFKGFDHFVQTLIATFIQMAPMLLLMIPVMIGFFVFGIATGAAAGSSGGDAAAPLLAGGMLVGMLVFGLLIVAVSLAIGLFFMFSYQLVVDRRLPAWEACKLSAQAALANLGGALGLLLLQMLLSFGGVLLCYVGVFFAMPIGFAAIDVAYRRVFPEVEGLA
jgi:uncharacterized membrane protein